MSESAQERPKSNRMPLSKVVERLTEARKASSSVTIKMSAAGQLMPEVDVAAGEDWETIRTMVDQAEWAFTEIYGRALTDPHAAVESAKRSKEAAAKAQHRGTRKAA